MEKTVCLILAVIFFILGAFPKLASSNITWQNAGLAMVTLSLLV